MEIVQKWGNMDVNYCKSKALILTQDKEIIKILSHLLLNKNIEPFTTSNLNEIDNDYCLIIVGHDINITLFLEKLKEYKGILPNVIFLENGNYFSLNSSKISCKCKKVSLPMEIFYLEQHIDEILNLSFY